MTYQERNRLKKEISVLIDRIQTLQEQEKVYENKEIDLKKIDLKIKAKNKIIKEKEENIQRLFLEEEKRVYRKKKQESEFKAVLKDIEKAKKDVSDEINNYHKQQEITKQMLHKNTKELAWYKQKITRAKEEYLKEKERLENIKNNLSTEEKEILQKIEDNQNIINSQKLKIEELEENIIKTKEDYKEVEEEYQTLLEKYIVT